MTKYIVWIENGVTTMGTIESMEGTIVKAKQLFAVVTMQYGVTDSGQLVHPNTPGVTKLQLDVQMSPYIVEGMLEGCESFTLDIASRCFNIIEDDKAPIVDLYKKAVMTMASPMKAGSSEGTPVLV